MRTTRNTAVRRLPARPPRARARPSSQTCATPLSPGRADCKTFSCVDGELLHDVSWPLTCGFDKVMVPEDSGFPGSEYNPQD